MPKVGLSKHLTVTISKANVNRLAKQGQMTSKQFVILIKAVLNETLQRTLEDIRLWILKYVPKRTGQLRFTLLKKLESSKVRRETLVFIIGSNLDYARSVNQMSTSQVRHNSHKEHSGEWAYAYYYSHKRRGPKVGQRRRKVGKKYKGPSNYRIFLYDPNAIGSFWDELIKYLRLRTVFHLNNAMREQYGKTELPWRIN